MKSIDNLPHTVDLGNGTRGHWIGDSSAEYVLFHCHGKSRCNCDYDFVAAVQPELL